MTLVTFLIPVFNEAKTLENSINQIINLDYQKKEIIIIDNNSDDGSKDIINKFSIYDNIKIIIKKKNLGYGDTIKKCFKLASGEIIYIHYSDLEYPVKGFFLMLNQYKLTNADIIFGERYNRSNLKFFFLEVINRPQYLGTFITTSLINFFYDVNLNDIIGSKMYKSATFKNFEIDRNNTGFDFEFVSRIMKKKLKFSKVLVPYVPRKKTSEKKIKFYHIFNAIFEILRIKFFY